MKTLHTFTQFVVLVSLPLLLGGCGEKESGAEVKPVEEAPINSIKYKITGEGWKSSTETINKFKTKENMLLRFDPESGERIP